jgi:hypothetical protein
VGPLAAAAIVVTLPVLLLTIVIQKEILTGMTAGGVKGDGMLRRPSTAVGRPCCMQVDGSRRFDCHRRCQFPAAANAKRSSSPRRRCPALLEAVLTCSRSTCA